MLMPLGGAFSARSDTKHSEYKDNKYQSSWFYHKNYIEQESKLKKYQNRLEFNPVDAIEGKPASII